MGRQWCHFCGFVYVQLQTRIALTSVCRLKGEFCAFHILLFFPVLLQFSIVIASFLTKS